MAYGGLDRAWRRFGSPAEDGRVEPFRDAKVIGIDGAGHWLHHDRLDRFLEILTDFLSTP